MCVSDCEAARVLHCKDRWDSDFEDSGPTETNQKLSKERFREKAFYKHSKNEMITKQYMHWDALLYKWTFGPHASPFFSLYNPIYPCCVSKRPQWAFQWCVLIGWEARNLLFLCIQNRWQHKRFSKWVAWQHARGSRRWAVIDLIYIVYSHFNWNLLYLFMQMLRTGMSDFFFLSFNVFQLHLKYIKYIDKKGTLMATARVSL